MKIIAYIPFPGSPLPHLNRDILTSHHIPQILRPSSSILPQHLCPRCLRESCELCIPLLVPLLEEAGLGLSLTATQKMNIENLTLFEACPTPLRWAESPQAPYAYFLRQ